MRCALSPAQDRQAENNSALWPCLGQHTGHGADDLQDSWISARGLMLRQQDKGHARRGQLHRALADRLALQIRELRSVDRLALKSQALPVTAGTDLPGLGHQHLAIRIGE